MIGPKCPNCERVMQGLRTPAEWPGLAYGCLSSCQRVFLFGRLRITYLVAWTPMEEVKEILWESGTVGAIDPHDGSWSLGPMLEEE